MSPPFNDRVLTKFDHRAIIMIEKIKNYIIRSAEDKRIEYREGRYRTVSFRSEKSC